jgi:plasmid stabilization system protein ParE
MNLVWVNSAVDDLERLRIFLAKENPDAAKRAAIAIKQAVNHLVTHPFIGKPVTDLPDYRDLFIRFGAGGYLLRYRSHENSAYILQIRHYREEDFQAID